MAGIGLLALAAWVLYLRPSDRLHRALALFFVLAGALEGLSAFTSPAYDLEGRLRVYALIAMPFAAANFMVVYWRRHGPGDLGQGRRWVSIVRWALLAAVVALEVAYLVDHRLFLSPGFQPGPFTLFIPGGSLALAAMGGALLVASSRAEDRGEARGLFLLGVGFALQPVYRAVSFLILLSSQAPFATSIRVLYGATLVLVVAAGLCFLLPGPQTGKHPRWVSSSVVLGLVGVAAGSGVVAARLFDAFGGLTANRVLWTLNGAWLAVLVLLATYAVLRYRLFDLDRKVQGALEGGTLATVLAGGFFLASESLERLAPVEGWISQLVVAGAIVLALRPLRSATTRLVRRVVDITPTSEELSERKAEIYRSTVEIELADGSIEGASRRRLDRLARELDLPVDTVQALEDQVVADRSGA